MAIRLVVQDYCSTCFDFDPDVTRPEKIPEYYFLDDITRTQITDTVVKCKNARRCENIKRYLEKQISKEG